LHYHFQGRPQDESSWLTLGKLYDVLVVMRDKNGWRLRLLGDEPNTTVLFPLDQFEVVNPTLARSWIAVWEENGLFELTPAPWTQLGFWDSYYNGETNAIQIFEEETNKIIKLGSEICPRCGQGLLLYATIVATDERIVVCDDCEALWKEDVFVASNKFVDMSTYLESQGLKGGGNELRIDEEAPPPTDKEA
jgi:ribosomal protein S27AE